MDESGGFANFRETATKTMSLVDRLRKLTLPALEDVREGLEPYANGLDQRRTPRDVLKRPRVPSHRHPFPNQNINHYIMTV